MGVAAHPPLQQSNSCLQAPEEIATSSFSASALAWDVPGTHLAPCVLRLLGPPRWSQRTPPKGAPPVSALDCKQVPQNLFPALRRAKCSFWHKESVVGSICDGSLRPSKIVCFVRVRASVWPERVAKNHEKVEFYDLPGVTDRQRTEGPGRTPPPAGKKVARGRCCAPPTPTK